MANTDPGALEAIADAYAHLGIPRPDLRAAAARRRERAYEMLARTDDDEGGNDEGGNDEGGNDEGGNDEGGPADGDQ